MIALRGERVVVMGLGLHGGGVAAVRWFCRHGALVTATDLRSAEILRPSIAALKKYKNVSFVLGKHRKKDFRSASIVVQNPAVPSDSPYLRFALQNGTHIINDLTMFLERKKGQVVGVTGTKGKTTVATLAAHLLRTKFGRRVVLAGNIPRHSLWDALDVVNKTTISVLELSSWQLEGLPRIRKSPSVAVVTNLLDDHLNRYSSRAAYAATKANIWRFQDASGVTILNRDDPKCRVWKARVPGQVKFFSLRPFAHDDGAFLWRGGLWIREKEKRVRILQANKLFVRGRHNIANALAALLVARYFRVPIRTIRQALQTFHGVPGRLEFVRRIKGRTFWNDTTATAPAATLAALKSFSRKPILIAGGTDKDLPYKELAVCITKRAKLAILLPGTATEKLRKYLRKHYRKADSMHEAVRVAMEVARPKDDIVLSPGAASFGLFVHEFDRGDQFIREVKAL